MQFDGSKLDIATLFVATAAAFIRPIRRKLTSSALKSDRKELGADFLNGTALVPFFVMVMAVLSSDIMKMAMAGDRLFLGVGGVLGLIFVLAELWKP